MSSVLPGACASRTVRCMPRKTAAMLRCSALMMPRARFMSASTWLDSTLATSTGNWVVSSRPNVAPRQHGVMPWAPRKIRSQPRAWAASWMARIGWSVVQVSVSQITPVISAAVRACSRPA